MPAHPKILAHIQHTHSQHLGPCIQSTTNDKKTPQQQDGGKQKATLMAAYKAVMRPALEYASLIWSPLASSASINKLQVMQNVSLRTATGCIEDTKHTNIYTTKHSYFPYTSTYSSTRHNTNRKHNTHNMSYTKIQHTSTLQSLKHYL